MDAWKPCDVRYFYPRSPCGERQWGRIDCGKSWRFLSTLSLRRATHQSWSGSQTPADFYPRSPCGERLHYDNYNLHCIEDFYPRSPCGERRCLRCCAISCITISIHALLAESDVIVMLYDPSALIFLSTLSLRRATYLGARKPCDVCHFYPRSPCGERRWLRCWQLAAQDISIHALLAESDDTWARGSRVTYVISIHALLAESDGDAPSSCFVKITFLSTLSLRRATEYFKLRFHSNLISIHALLAESDRRKRRR